MGDGMRISPPISIESSFRFDSSHLNSWLVIFLLVDIKRHVNDEHH